LVLDKVVRTIQHPVRCAVYALPRQSFPRLLSLVAFGPFCSPVHVFSSAVGNGHRTFLCIFFLGARVPPCFTVTAPTSFSQGRRNSDNVSRNGLFRHLPPPGLFRGRVSARRFFFPPGQSIRQPPSRGLSASPVDFRPRIFSCCSP